MHYKVLPMDELEKIADCKGKVGGHITAKNGLIVQMMTILNLD